MSTSSPRIAFIGAGSVVFSKNVIADLLWHPALRESHIALVDIDADKLQTAERMVQLINVELGAAATISATPDRRQALDGADFVICCIGVGGLDATRIDHAVPAQFGVRQTIGDTLGPGGVFRALRNVPEVLAICADMAELCPDALLINYSNPMAMHCLAIARATDINCVGLCHGVQNTAQTLRMIIAMAAESEETIHTHFSRPLGHPEREREWWEWMAKGLDPDLSYTCAGINHMAFFLRFESAGRDLYPDLWKAIEIPHIRRLDPVRLELFEYLGYFMTETSWHTAEYLPYYLKDDQEIADHHIPVSGYVETCEHYAEEYPPFKAAVLAGETQLTAPYTPSNEHASRIVNAMVTGQPYVFNGNVHNTGGSLISNLPADSCVEVPCVVDRQGIQPTAVGELPPQCAALIRTNINVQDLTVRGLLEERRDHILHALLVDPCTSSQISANRTRELVDAMFAAHKA
jgi:alpha-galactosidase